MENKKYITIMLSDEEKDLIKRSSKRLGMGHSTYCKMLALQDSRKNLEVQTA